jgi:nitrogen-specific signal transduction histidine kinase
MTRRYWHAALAIIAVLVFASYLAYTQYLVTRIKEQSELNSRIYSLVQRGLIAEPGEELSVLFEIQAMLDSLGVPIVVFNAAGEPQAGLNTPFDPTDPTTEPGRQALREFTAHLESRNPTNKVVVGTGTVYFGDPPLLAWLRWVPWLQVTGALLLIVVAVAIVRADIRAERERLWAAMARELAHQMGTPLSSLSGWIEVLALPSAEREQMAATEHIASVIAADVERLERVSRRFELIGKPPVLETVGIGEVVCELESYFGPRLPKLGRGIRLRTRVDPDAQPIRANRVLLVWALENVVKNAVDALAGRGGKILILAHRGEDDLLHVHVADDGPGISPTVRDRIFEPGVSTKSGGWGVGLSLTRRIIQELHGGRVTVRSRRNRGTVFDIVLPAASA